MIKFRKLTVKKRPFFAKKFRLVKVDGEFCMQPIESKLQIVSEHNIRFPSGH